ncbi:unnamed protein product, partial [Adineta steineri]
MPNRNRNQSREGNEENANEQQENAVTPVDEQNNNVANNNNPNPTPPAPARASTWDTIKSMAFRMLMFYFVTQFFRRSPASNTAGNSTLSTNLNSGFTPGNLYANGDLLVMNFSFEKK